MRQTLREAFEHSLRLHASSPAIEFDGRQLTYAEIDRWSASMADNLRALGVAPGDVVAIYMRNRPEFLVLDVAVARIGAVKLPLNYMLPRSSVTHCLRKGAAKLLVTDTDLLDEASGAVQDLPNITIVGLAECASRTHAHLPTMCSLPAPGTAVPELPEFTSGEVGATSPAAVYFSGGTTGLPKGIVHNQASTLALHYAQLLEAEILQDERLLLMTPLAHAAGLFGQSALIRGATIVLTDGFDAEQTAKLLTSARITWTFLVPTMIYRLLDTLSEREVDLAIRTIVYGAAPISPARLEQALQIFGPVFIQLYGQTESPNWGTRLSKQDHDISRPHLLSSCGQASILAEVKVVDDDDAPQKSGRAGEICLRTPYLLDRYIGDPEATQEKFLGDWIRTGDIGMLDEDGYLYLLDRKSDMVISGGMNVYCREVEDILSTHPGIRVAAVIGIPHEDWGEAVHAVVVPAQSGLDPAELVEWTRGKLASYARPKTVELVELLPETPFGKVDKKALRAAHWSGREREIG